MKERLHLLFLVFFFTSWGHFQGSGGKDLGESISYGFGAAIGILLILIISSMLDNTMWRKHRTGPIGSMNTIVAERRRRERLKIRDEPIKDSFLEFASDPNFPGATRPADMPLSRQGTRANGREGGVN